MTLKQRALTLVLVLTACVLLVKPIVITHQLFVLHVGKKWEHQMSQSQSSNPLKDLARVAAEVVKLLPDGSTIYAYDFGKLFGADTVQLLGWLQVTEITRAGNRVTSERAGATSQNIYNVLLILEKTVAFDVVQNQAAVVLTDVQGVKVDAGNGFGALNLKEASVSQDASGNSVIAVKLQIARFLPYLPITVRLAPDGQLLPD